VQIYTTVVNRARRVVYLVKPVGHQVQIAWLFSTDLSLGANTLVPYYKARF
jgi:hypothetical protein